MSACGVCEGSLVDDDGTEYCHVRHALARLTRQRDESTRQLALRDVEVARLRAEVERMRAVYEAAKSLVERERKLRKENAEINERLNRGEAVSWTTTISSTPTTWALELAVDAAITPETP